MANFTIVPYRKNGQKKFKTLIHHSDGFGTKNNS